MPKKTAAAAKKKTPVRAKKAPAKPKLKASAKPVASAKGTRRGFMWKVLEQKQKQPRLSPIPQAEREDHVHPTADQAGYSRFNGPRRRVG